MTNRTFHSCPRWQAAPSPLHAHTTPRPCPRAAARLPVSAATAWRSPLKMSLSTATVTNYHALCGTRHDIAAAQLAPRPLPLYVSPAPHHLHASRRWRARAFRSLGTHCVISAWNFRQRQKLVILCEEGGATMRTANIAHRSAVPRRVSLRAISLDFCFHDALNNSLNQISSEIRSSYCGCCCCRRR